MLRLNHRRSFVELAVMHVYAKLRRSNDNHENVETVESIDPMNYAKPPREQEISRA